MRHFLYLRLRRSPPGAGRAASLSILASAVRLRIGTIPEMSPMSRVRVTEDLVPERSGARADQELLSEPRSRNPRVLVPLVGGRR
jgi:hypothetical protein